ncbi:MAG: ATP-dependent DNA helicase [Bacteroidales bacterium]
MTKTFLLDKIVSNLPYTPTEDQFNMLNLLADFLFLKNETSLFLLKGYAGTGKSSLIGGVVQTIRELNQKVVLLAPTGRAARVFSHYSGMEAQTIHRKIYRQKTYSSESFEFTTNRNPHKDTLFIVDEASMISNQQVDGATSSQGQLLDDLMEYVYSSDNCRLILIGDTAQLPPIGQSVSPAMDKGYLEGYGMDVAEAVLTKVVRQAEESGILWNATLLRDRMNAEEVYELPRLTLDGFSDIRAVSGEDFLELLNDSYRQVGEEEVLIITRSNKRANLYNNGVRARVLYREDEISSGDLLLIAKNNYALAEEYPELGFIANGETAEILRVRRQQEIYGSRFAEVTLRLIDRDLTIDAKVNMDTLHSETSALSQAQQSKLFYAIAEDYRYDCPENVVIRKIKKDPFYNALQVKYAYCMTCHKAQGGQWKHIYIDLGNLNPEYMGLDFYRWLYTAMTRATEKLYLVNMPDEMRE